MEEEGLDAFSQTLSGIPEFDKIPIQVGDLLGARSAAEADAVAERDRTRARTGSSSTGATWVTFREHQPFEVEQTCPLTGFGDILFKEMIPDIVAPAKKTAKLISSSGGSSGVSGSAASGRPAFIASSSAPDTDPDSLPKLEVELRIVHKKKTPRYVEIRLSDLADGGRKLTKDQPWPGCGATSIVPGSVVFFFVAPACSCAAWHNHRHVNMCRRFSWKKKSPGNILH